MKTLHNTQISGYAYRIGKRFNERLFHCRLVVGISCML